MAALPAVVPMASGMLAIEMLKSGCDMAREISLYQQKIAEIELQREHMLSQAALMRLQIKQHAKTAKRELNTLSSGFKDTLQHAERLTRDLQQQVEQNHQQLNQLMNHICQCQDMQKLSFLQEMWRNLQLSQSELSGERAKLSTQLFDAYVQFGLNVSHRVDHMSTVR